jgi:hypothetical protein
MKLIQDNIFDKYNKFIDYKKLSINQDLINDELLKPLLDKFILLNNYSYLFTSEPNLNIYYNKFYWYSKLMNEYIKKYGKDDLNLAQGRFKILEEGGNLPDIVDWNIIEKIYNEFNSD